jgi:hypothetical protein
MKIHSFKQMGDYKLELTFTNGVQKVVDLYTFIAEAKNPMTAQFINKRLFQEVRLSHGHLSWLDGEMDLSAESLFNWK